MTFPEFPSRRPSASIRAVSQSDLVRAALVVVATLVGLQLLWSARFFVLTGFLGILFGLSAAQAVDWIQTKVRIKRSLAAAGVVFGVVALLVLVALWTGPTLAEQSGELRTKLPEAIGKLEEWVAAKQPALLDAVAPPDTSLAPGASRILHAVGQQGDRISGFAFGVLQSTVTVFAAIVMIIFLTVYIAAEPETYRRGTLMLIPLERRHRVEELFDALGKALRTWFATQLIAMLVIGVITTVLLAIIGVPGALPLGVIAGIFEFIPNVGPTLSAIPAILMGLVESPQLALTVALVYWGIQFLENNLLIPYLMSEQLDLPPALTLITQVVMAYVFGFLGLFVAIPMLATVVVVVRMFWVDEDLPPLPTMEMPAAARRRTQQLQQVQKSLDLDLKE